MLFINFKSNACLSLPFTEATSHLTVAVAEFFNQLCCNVNSRIISP